LLYNIKWPKEQGSSGHLSFLFFLILTDEASHLLLQPFMT
jgi:hypothetical protein